VEETPSDKFLLPLLISRPGHKRLRITVDHTTGQFTSDGRPVSTRETAVGLDAIALWPHDTPIRAVVAERTFTDKNKTDPYEGVLVMIPTANACVTDAPTIVSAVDLDDESDGEPDEPFDVALAWLRQRCQYDNKGDT